MAKSRYLTIDVVKSVIKVGENGTLTEDVRFNKPSKDGDSYTDDGKYTFTVKNLYTDGDSTIKTIYVGMNKYLRFFSKSGTSVSELNEKIFLGAKIAEDGTLVEVVKENINQNNDITTEIETIEKEDLVTTQNIISKPIAVISIVVILSVFLVLIVVKQKLDKNKIGKNGDE
jgi:hypothetical protein